MSLVVSVVSHGHHALVQSLLHSLSHCCTGTVSRVVLTLNLPERLPVAPAAGWPFVLQTVRNVHPLGFGANHNRALTGVSESFVCILNPDVQLAGVDPLAVMVRVAGQAGVGCAYPTQVDASGVPQDSERALPTPTALLRRRIGRRPELCVDWVNAACLVLPAQVWRNAGGFDASYFMYCEDVDLSLRLRLAGLTLVRAPVQVVHAGQRDSHRRWSHLRWHVKSLWRLWQSPVYRLARRSLRPQPKGAGTIGAS